MPNRHDPAGNGIGRRGAAAPNLWASRPCPHCPGTPSHHVRCCILPHRKRPARHPRSPRRGLLRHPDPARGDNFRLSGVPLAHYPKLVVALAMVKQAAADANHRLGHLDDAKHAAISQACARLIRGEFHEQFVVDVIQGGAGTSTNMNANEVIANLALEVMGRPKGDYQRAAPEQRREHARSPPTTPTRPPIRLGLLLEPSTPCWRAWQPDRGPSQRRARSSPGCSRWAAPSCRTRCR